MLKRIPLDLITRNPDQPRQNFDKVKLEELANSIQERGLIQPITVRPIDPTDDGHQYMIVAGERRFRAHMILAEDGEAVDILAHVRKMDDETMHIDAIIENLQRTDVSPLEEAMSYQRMIDDYGFTPEALAKKLGISQSWRIEYRTRLLGLTEDNRNMLCKNIISMTQAYHMAKLSTNGQQEFLKICMAGFASTDKAAAEAADAIDAKEAQIEMPMPEQPNKRVSIKTIEDSIDKLGSALQPFFKDGPFKVKSEIDPNEAKRCIEKLKLLKRHLGQIDGELNRAASLSALV